MQELNEINEMALDFFDFLADCSTNDDFKNSMQAENDTELAIEFLADYPCMIDDFE